MKTMTTLKTLDTIQAMCQRVYLEGDAPALGRIPDGEVVVRDARFSVSYPTHLLLASDGAMWLLKDAVEGWEPPEMNLNCGSAHGRRLYLSKHETTAFLASIADHDLPVSDEIQARIDASVPASPEAQRDIDEMIRREMDRYVAA